MDSAAMIEVIAVLTLLYIFIGIIAAISLAFGSGLSIGQIKLPALVWIVFCWPRLWWM